MCMNWIELCMHVVIPQQRYIMKNNSSGFLIYSSDWPQYIIIVLEK